MSKQTPEDNLDTSMRIIQKATTDTISGKSKLEYHIGVTPDNEIHFRIHGNTGGGFFSQEWISLKDIQDVFDENPEGQPISSIVLQSLFKGKSVNTPAFLLAALANEKLVRVMKGKKRGHIVMDPEDFTSRMEKLMSSGVKAKSPAKAPIKKTAAKKTATKKAAIKKRSASTVKASSAG